MKPWLVSFLAVANVAGPMVGFCIDWKSNPHDCTGPFTDAERWAYVFVSLLLIALSWQGWVADAKLKRGA